MREKRGLEEREDALYPQNRKMENKDKIIQQVNLGISLRVIIPPPC